MKKLTVFMLAMICAVSFAFIGCKKEEPKVEAPAAVEAPKAADAAADKKDAPAAEKKADAKAEPAKK